MSTRTNLNDQIRWLLRENPVVPAYITPPATAPNSSLNGSDTLELYVTADEQELYDGERRDVQEAELRPQSQPKRSSKLQTDRATEPMARLISAPGSSRKRRLVQNDDQGSLNRSGETDIKQSVKRSTSISQPEDGGFAVSTRTTPKPLISPKKDEHVTPVYKSSPSVHSLERKYSSSFEDFTEPLRLWTEKHALRKEPNQKQGKKRKSSEMAKSGKLKKTPARSILLDDDEFDFTPIDELDLQQLERDEAVSATPSKSKRLRNNKQVEALVDKDGVPDDLEMLDLMANINAEDDQFQIAQESQTRPAFASQKPGSITSVQSQLGDLLRSPAGSFRQRARSVKKSFDCQVCDSDEDEVLSPRKIGKAYGKEDMLQHGGLVPAPTSLASTAKEYVGVITQQKLIARPPPPSTLSKDDISYPQLSITASPFHSDSPTRGKSSSSSSKRSREAVPATPAPQRDQSVDTFLNIQKHTLNEYLSSLEQQMNERLDAMWLSGEAGEMDEAAQHEAETLRDEVSDFEDLMTLYDEYQILAEKARALQNNFKQAFRERRAVNSRDYQLLPKERERMKEIEHELVKRIERCRHILSSRLSEELLQAQTPPLDSLRHSAAATGDFKSAKSITHIPLSPNKKLKASSREAHSFDEVPSTPSRALRQRRPTTPPASSRGPSRASNERARTPLRALRPAEQARNSTNVYSPRHQNSRSKDRLRAALDEDVENRIDFEQHMGSPTRPDHLALPGNQDFLDNGFAMDDDEDMLDYLADLEEQNTRSSLKQYSAVATSNRKATSNNSSIQATKTQSKQAKPSRGAQSLMSFPWSKDLKTALVHRFGLQGFRHNQLEAINATLSGKDTFVLMPTGGGKSLCYQLPAVVNSGKSRGVTIVVSPLLSLMQDQVQHLREINVQASLINGETSPEAKAEIMGALRGPDPGRFIQLLYVTPEMLSKNKTMISLFKGLNSRGQIARIVVDEAHCVSQWGHDFRPDYKCIGEFRRELSGLPLMALTATATENVKMDVIQNLGMTACEVFTQSFNRPNLYYEVHKKGSGTLDAIAKLINDRHHRQCGIIYCLSRKTCERTAEQLRDKHGILAQHYHAGMESEEKVDAQTRWQTGSCHVIVATIAFGMGIDKANVRYVIHHSVPKSLEGYYQETGRAGRDGKPSRCYLFYLFKDVTTIDKMIREDTNSNQAQKDRQLAMLREVNRFCDNRADCRRMQILSYFNERFTADECNKTCDNCNSNLSFEKRDMSILAKAAIDLVKAISDHNFTKHQCVDILRGSGAKNSRRQEAEDLGAPCIGNARGQDRGTVERLFNLLITERALQETHVVKMDFPIAYLGVGDRWREFWSGTEKVELDVSQSPTPSRKKKAANTIDHSRDEHEEEPDRARVKSIKKHPTSTMLSSPSNHRIPQRTFARQMNGTSAWAAPTKMQPIMSQESDSEFEPVRDVRRAKAPRRTPDLGPPILHDPVLADLDEPHRAIIEQALEGLTTRAREIMEKKGLRRQPFTDTQLRTMLIDFPATEDDMLKIPGVRKDIVREYGRHFFALIQDARGVLEAMREGSHNASAFSLNEASESDDHIEKVHDKNHDLSVIVIDSDEDAASYAGEYDLDADATGQFSEYFRPPPDVEAFNARMSQAMPGIAASTTSAANGRGRRTGQTARSAVGYRKSSSGKFKNAGKAGRQKGSTSRSFKTAASSSRSSQKSGLRATTKKADLKSKGGLDGYMTGGGIGVMPT